MITAALLFLASFAVVFGLGVQQHNVHRGHRGLAFTTSLLIGAATLVQLKVLPGPTTWLDIAGYLLGSACGIVASMWAHPRLVALLRRPRRTRLSTAFEQWRTHTFRDLDEFEQAKRLDRSAGRTDPIDRGSR